MANTSRATGFQLQTQDAFCIDYLVVNGGVLKQGDTVYLDSAGYANSTASGIALGVAMDDMRDGIDASVKATAETASYDYISVNVNINSIYKAQISTGALTSPYTTRSSAAAYDEAGAAGVQYIDAAASTNDTWRIIGTAAEDGNGSKSAAGAYQKVFCKLNPAACAFGTIA